MMIGLTILCKAVLPVLVVLLYAAAVASAAYMIKRGNE